MIGLEEEAPANSVPAATVRRGGGEGQVFFRMKIPFRRREKNITIEAEGKAGLYQAPGRFRSDWQ